MTSAARSLRPTLLDLRPWRLIPLVWSKPRHVVLVGLILSYVWRFHDLHPVLAPLRLSALFTGASWLLLIVQPRTTRLRAAIQQPSVRLFLLWTVWILVGAFTGLSFARTWVFFYEDHIKAVAYVLFIVGSLDSFAELQLAAVAHLGGALILALFYVKGGFGTWGSPVEMYDVNDMALLFNMAIPFAYFFATQSPRRRVRIAAWATAGLLAVCVAATRSRGGFLTLLLVGLFLMWRSRGVGSLARVAPLAVAVAGFYFAPQEARTRILTVLALSEDYNVTAEDGRLAIWRRGMHYVRQYPAAGVGAGNFSLAERTISNKGGIVAHNSYVEVAADTGFVGLTLFVLMLLASQFTVIRLRRRYAGSKALAQRRAFCDACSAALVAWTFGATFLAWGYSIMLYSMLALVAGLAIVDRRELGPRATGRAGEHAPRGPASNP